MSAALMESGQRVKVRHSRYSRIRQAEAREALAIVHTIADDFAAHLSQLAATTVTDRQWAAFLDAHAILPSGASTRTRTSVEKKRASLDRLWAYGGFCVRDLDKLLGQEALQAQRRRGSTVGWAPTTD